MIVRESDFTPEAKDLGLWSELVELSGASEDQKKDPEFQINILTAEVD